MYAIKVTAAEAVARMFAGTTLERRRVIAGESAGAAGVPVTLIGSNRGRRCKACRRSVDADGMLLSRTGAGAAASSAVSGGHRRVLTWPGTGALAKMTNAVRVGWG